MPANLEQAILAKALSSNGFDFEKRSFFIWLGTVPYLTEDSIRATLQTLGEVAGGAEIVFDYAEPVGSRSTAGEDRFRELADSVAGAGEPFVSLLESDVIKAAVRSAGFQIIEDYSVRDLVERQWGIEAVEARARAGTPYPHRGAHVTHRPAERSCEQWHARGRSEVRSRI